MLIGILQAVGDFGHELAQLAAADRYAHHITKIFANARK
jgi:hypothetical protein